MNDRDLTGMMMRLRVIILSAIFRLVNYYNSSGIIIGIPREVEKQLNNGYFLVDSTIWYTHSGNVYMAIDGPFMVDSLLKNGDAQ